MELDHTKTCRSTLFNCTDRKQLATDFAGSPRTVSPDEQWCKLISVRRTQFHVPLGTQTFQPSASIDASKAMEEHVHGFAPGHCQHGLFPELAANNFPLFQTRSYQVRDSFLPTVRRLQCRVLQVTLDVKDLFLLEIPRPILRGAPNVHFICAHGHHHGDLHRQSLENVFQATRRFDASKQHRRSIRRFADHGSVQRPLFYGIEIVRVLTGNAVQVIPTFFVGVSPPDIFFSRRCPLGALVVMAATVISQTVPTEIQSWKYETMRKAVFIQA